MRRKTLTDKELKEMQQTILLDYIDKQGRNDFNLSSFCIAHSITCTQLKAMMCQMGINLRPIVKKQEKEGEMAKNQDFFYYGVTDDYAEECNAVIEAELGLKHRECTSDNYQKRGIHGQMEYSKFMTIISIINLESTLEDLDIIHEVWKVLKKYGKNKSYK